MTFPAPDGRFRAGLTQAWRLLTWAVRYASGPEAGEIGDRYQR
ncbi:hypothetical protein [Streptomyces griseoruber]|nr:hypothetical protein [Streptomyces griseoruber]